MNRLEKWCHMCGAAPGEPCKVVSGSGEQGDRPGDARPDTHWARTMEEKPAVLIPDEPDYADEAAK